MKENIIEEAAQLKAQIQQNELTGNTLYQFAKKHSPDKSLINRALILQLNYKSLNPGTAHHQLTLEINQLIDDILVLRDEKGAKLTQRRQEEEQLHQVFLARKPKEELVVKLEEVEKTYKGSGFKLGPVNAEFRLGEISGLVGANANGKTTLLKIIAGELYYNKGSLTYPYLGIHRPKKQWGKLKRSIAYVPQELERWHGTLRQHLHYTAAMHGIYGADNETAVNYIVHRLGLIDYTDRSWNELSGGFKLRFALARALIWNPSLLIIDEPLANLDVSAQIVILNDLKDLAHSFKNPICVIISSQHLHEIESVADKLILLDEGAVTYSGRRADFAANRSQNIFEFQTALSHIELKRLLEPFPHQNLHFNGFFFVIRCDKEVAAGDFIDYCRQQNIDLEYFRNISTSVKQYFV